MKGWRVIPLPFLVFAAGVWLYFQTENEVWAQISRAQLHWRSGEYRQAAALYEKVRSRYPKSRYLDTVLWKLANLYYVNLDDVDAALSCYSSLVERRPSSPLTARAYLKMAEIEAVELSDLPQAIEYLGHALALGPRADLRWRILFRLGTLHLRLNQFEQAAQRFRLVASGAPDPVLRQQARARVGSVLQIEEKYRESIPFFKAVLEHPECPECRLECRLGLIESYEFLGDFRKAIQTALEIPDTEYPKTLREQLLERLRQKASYYEPKVWHRP